MKKIGVWLVVLAWVLVSCSGSPPETSSSPQPSTANLPESTTSSTPSPPSTPETTPPSTPPSSEEIPSGLLYQEDFSQLSSRWQESESAITDNANTYLDGSYRMQAGRQWNRERAGLEFQDFMFQVEATPVAADHGDYGVIVRTQPYGEDYYQFDMNAGGGFGNPSFTLSRYEGGEATELAHDYTEVIYKADGTSTNLIQVTCLGGKISVAINGTTLAEVNDYAFRSGDIGLAVQEMTVDFDNLQVWAVEGGIATPPATPDSGILFSDDFSTSESSWTSSTGPDEGEFTGVQDGAYHIRTDVFRSGRARRDFRDFNLSVEAEAAEPRDYYSAGVIVRYQDQDNCYHFGIEYLPDRANWYLQKYSDGQMTPLLEGSAYDARGHITFLIDCQGSHFTLYLNGSKLGETDDNEIKEGDIGFFVRGVGDMTEVAFSNLRVSSLP